MTRICLNCNELVAEGCCTCGEEQRFEHEVADLRQRLADCEADRRTGAGALRLSSQNVADLRQQLAASQQEAAAAEAREQELRQALADWYEFYDAHVLISDLEKVFGGPDDLRPTNHAALDALLAKKDAEIAASQQEKAAATVELAMNNVVVTTWANTNKLVLKWLHEHNQSELAQTDIPAALNAALKIEYSRGWDEGVANLLHDLRDEFAPEWTGEDDGQGAPFCGWCRMLEPDGHTDDCIWILLKAGKPHLEASLAAATLDGLEAGCEDVIRVYQCTIEDMAKRNARVLANVRVGLNCPNCGAVADVLASELDGIDSGFTVVCSECDKPITFQLFKDGESWNGLLAEARRAGPEAAVQWLTQRAAVLRLGVRNQAGERWLKPSAIAEIVAAAEAIRALQPDAPPEPLYCDVCGGELQREGCNHVRECVPCRNSDRAEARREERTEVAQTLVDCIGSTELLNAVASAVGQTNWVFCDVGEDGADIGRQNAAAALRELAEAIVALPVEDCCGS